jgi:single-stranded-DNA-specific exonuclease
VPGLLAAALIGRGIRDPGEADAFLNPSLDALHDPLLLPDCDQAVAQVMLAKENRERVYVHGDYDVDGVSSAAIWTRSLQKLGLHVVAHVPHRMKEGYGIHEIAVRDAAESGAKLFLTCDCGSAAFETVALARELGMRVVVTDHHAIGDTLPNAHAVVNPHRSDSTYPFPALAGAGVAFKVAQAVAEAAGASRDSFFRAYLDLACLGTIADIVPLVGENRILAAFGLRQLAETKKVGLQALLKVAMGTDSRKPPSSGDVGWRLGPRLNAAGRVDDADLALRLLLTADETEAASLAGEIDRHNSDRKAIQASIEEEVDEVILKEGLYANPLLFIASDGGWHRGVLGIVAGRVARRYCRPALVAAVDPETGEAHGSARSIPGFDLHAALQANRDLFLSCGGHAAAAGFRMDADRVDEAAERLVGYAASILKDEDLVPTVTADASIAVEELDMASVESLSRLEPTGEANPAPQWALRGVELTRVQPTSKPEHVQFSIRAPVPIDGIGFGMGESFAGRSPGDLVDILVSSEIDEWNGRRKVKLRLHAIESADLD